MGELAGYDRIHVVGVGGSGIRGLAKLLAQQGHAVTGSDLKPGNALHDLVDLGIETWVGHQPDRAGEWDLVVASSAVPARDPELQAAAAAGTPVWARPQLLQALTAEMPALGVSGTHGKTTSTALAVCALRAAGRDPSFLVGGDLLDLNTGAHLGERDLFVMEADEAYGTFIDLHMRGLIVTNVEADHLDHYQTVGRLEEAFLTVARGVEGPVLAGIDDPGARRLAESAGSLTYGTSPAADWVVDNVVHGQWEVRFRLRGSDGALAVAVPRPGLHIARNAAGVLALLAETGIDIEAAAGGLADFAGVRRRYEVRSRVGDITVVEDYAHLPTELAATLGAARLGKWHRVWAVFQPHRYSRTAELAAPLGASLRSADRVVVTDVYGAGERPEPGITGKLVADAARAAGAGDVTYLPRLRDLADHVAASAEPGDLVLLLGAGDITTVADALAESLGQRR